MGCWLIRAGYDLKVETSEFFVLFFWVSQTLIDYFFTTTLNLFTLISWYGVARKTYTIMLRVVCHSFIIR